MTWQALKLDKGHSGWVDVHNLPTFEGCPRPPQLPARLTNLGKEVLSLYAQYKEEKNKKAEEKLRYVAERPRARPPVPSSSPRGLAGPRLTSRGLA